MLSPAEMELIHLGACRLLSRIGVKVTHEVIAEKLISRGAQRKGDRITIPANMVENALGKTEKLFNLMRRIRPMALPSMRLKTG